MTTLPPPTPTARDRSSWRATSRIPRPSSSSTTAWWDKPEHNLKRIEFRPIKSDATRVAALLSGELDMVAPTPLQDLARIAAAPGFKVVENPSLRLIFLGLNWRPELIGQPGQKNPLLDLKVRQALWHGDRSRHHPEARHARQVPHRRPLVAPPVPGYSAEHRQAARLRSRKPPRSCSPTQAIPTASRSGLACPNDRYIADEQTCVAIAAMWNRIGVQVDLKTESRADLFPESRPRRDRHLHARLGHPAADGRLQRAVRHPRPAQGRLRRQQPERPVERAARRTHQARRRGARRAQAPGHADGSAEDRA